jgi:hypothetical protein
MKRYTSSGAVPLPVSKILTAFHVEPERRVIQADPKGSAVDLEVPGRRIKIKPGHRIERKLRGPTS